MRTWLSCTRRTTGHNGTEVSVSFYRQSEPTAPGAEGLQKSRTSHPSAFEFLPPSWTFKAAKPALETLCFTVPAKPPFCGTASFKEKQCQQYPPWKSTGLDSNPGSGDDCQVISGKPLSRREPRFPPL